MKTIYIQLKKNIILPSDRSVKLKDIGLISAKENLISQLMDLTIYEQEAIKHHELIIDGLFIIKKIQQIFPHIQIRLIGETYTVASVKKKVNHKHKIFVPIIWLILFIGSAMTIMNFHHDVGMQEVQQKIHYMLTGQKNKYPLWIQIPYSVGLGIGMILFFNYWFTKRFNKEPSPLEVEMFKYDQDIAQYKHYQATKNDDTSY